LSTWNANIAEEKRGRKEASSEAGERSALKRYRRQGRVSTNKSSALAGTGKRIVYSGEGLGTDRKNRAGRFIVERT